MKLSYKVFMVFFSMLFLVSLSMGQEIGEVMWQDLFDDAENDFLLNNVGWLYFGEEDDLIGQEVGQTEDGKGWIKNGIFNTIIGGSIIESNGVDYIDPADFDGSIDRVKVQNNNISPNQDITFQVNFKKYTLVEGGTYPMGTFFLCGTRMFNPDTSRGYGDPIADSTYILYISPLTDQVNVAKLSGDLVILNPALWTYWAEAATFDFDLDVWYWVEFYLFEGELKVKIWEGDFADGAGEDWLLEVTDPEPWVRGTFTEFGMLGDPLENGDETLLDDVVVREVTGGASAIDDGGIDVVPTEFALGTNYPNPFNPETTIEFSLVKTDEVSLKIYSITGQLVRTLANGAMEAGAHKVRFNGRDDLGNLLSSGVYFYQLQSAGQIATNKMILMK